MMNSIEIMKKVQDIFIDILEEPSIRLENETTANDIEDWDSLTHIQLIVEIEKQFNIEFKLEEVQGFRNVGEMCECISRKLG